MTYTSAGGIPDFEVPLYLGESHPTLVNGVQTNHTIDGLRVPPSHFGRMFEFAFGGIFGVVERQARLSAIPVGYQTDTKYLIRRSSGPPTLTESPAPRPGGPMLPTTSDGESEIYGTYTVTSPIYSDNWAAAWQTQDRPFDIDGIRRGIRRILEAPKCKLLIKELLNSAATKNNPVEAGGDLSELFESLIKQEKGGLTREHLGSAGGVASAAGRFKDGTAKVSILPSSSGTATQQLWIDIDYTLGEIMHIAFRNRTVSDRGFAEAVYKNKEWAKLNGNGGPDSEPLIFPLDDPNLSKKERDELRRNTGDARWSRYWHNVLGNVCQYKIDWNAITR